MRDKMVSKKKYDKLKRRYDKVLDLLVISSLQLAAAYKEQNKIEYIYEYKENNAKSNLSSQDS